MTFGKPDQPTIALVEDNSDNRDVLCVFLQDFYQVVCFTSAGEALQAIGTHNPALILTDLWLPDISGWQFLTTLRGQGVQTPVVAVTAYVVEGIREKVLAAGFAASVAKPILDMDGLHALIERLLKQESTPMTEVENAHLAPERISEVAESQMLLTESELAHIGKC